VLAAAQRLRRSSEFAAVIRGGRRAGRGAVVVHLDLSRVPTPDQTVTSSVKPALPAGVEDLPPPARAGFVVSKAVGNAVVRNTVRRRLRHLVRERLAGLPPGSTLVVRALPSAAEQSYARLGADVDAAITAARSPRRSGRRAS
jgi:ribonuclease P protein component